MNVDISFEITPVLLVAIVVAGVLVILLVLLGAYLLCCRKDGRNSNRPQNITVENPPEAADNHDGGPAQQWPQQNNQLRMADLPISPAAAAGSPLQEPPSHSPTYPPAPPSSLSSTPTGTSSAPKTSKLSPSLEVSPSYTSSNRGSGTGRSNLLGHESSLPSSPVVSFGSAKTAFTYEELAMATNGFSKANILGQGGFGIVHKGVLPNGKEIAVKSLKPNSKQGEREFQAEVDVFSRVHHRHLVSLVGYCITGSQRMLVYEFVAKKTLAFHLHGKGRSMMDWGTRFKIAVGAAKGLAYLHEDCHPKIIHRDIKAANILLDDNFQAKVADFGLARFASEADTHVSTRVMGTLGYLAPEYASTGQLTEKSDVYSFGVVLLELITGRLPVDKTQKEQNLVEWARPLLTTAMEEENFNYLVDPQLQYCYKSSEMARMVSCAAHCVRKSARRRPLMSQVFRALEGNISLPDLHGGITPGLSLVNRSNESNTVYSDNQYSGDSKDFDSKSVVFATAEYFSTGEHDGTTSEYGLCPSSSSGYQATQELDTQEVMRENKRFQQQQF